MYKCDNCKYAIFRYTDIWKIKNIYCKRLNGTISKSKYNRLKFCIFYEKIEDSKTIS